MDTMVLIYYESDHVWKSRLFIMFPNMFKITTMQFEEKYKNTHIPSCTVFFQVLSPSQLLSMLYSYVCHVTCSPCNRACVLVNFLVRGYGFNLDCLFLYQYYWRKKNNQLWLTAPWTWIWSWFEIKLWKQGASCSLTVYKQTPIELNHLRRTFMSVLYRAQQKNL